MDIWNTGILPTIQGIPKRVIGLPVLPTLTAALPGQSWGVSVGWAQSADSTTTNTWLNKMEFMFATW